MCRAQTLLQSQTKAKRRAVTAGIPINDIGLVLGSSARLGSGHVNPHFRNRVEAAARLYRAGKVKHLLLSGDNHIASYDEPTDSKPVPFEYSGSTRTREWFARVKAFLDVYALQTQPRFYGPKIKIIVEPYHS